MSTTWAGLACQMLAPRPLAPHSVEAVDQSQALPLAVALIEIQQPGGPVSLGQSECNHSAIDC
jgi:hypothetical protein